MEEERKNGEKKEEWGRGRERTGFEKKRK